MESIHESLKTNVSEIATKFAFNIKRNLSELIDFSFTWSLIILWGMEVIDSLNITNEICENPLTAT